MFCLTYPKFQSIWLSISLCSPANIDPIQLYKRLILLFFSSISLSRAFFYANILFQSNSQPSSISSPSINDEYCLFWACLSLGISFFTFYFAWIIDDLLMNDGYVDDLLTNSPIILLFLSISFPAMLHKSFILCFELGSVQSLESFVMMFLISTIYFYKKVACSFMACLMSLSIQLSHCLCNSLFLFLSVTTLSSHSSNLRTYYFDCFFPLPTKRPFYISVIIMIKNTNFIAQLDSD